MTESCPSEPRGCAEVVPTAQRRSPDMRRRDIPSHLPVRVDLRLGRTTAVDLDTEGRGPLYRLLRERKFSPPVHGNHIRKASMRLWAGRKNHTGAHAPGSRLPEEDHGFGTPSSGIGRGCHPTLTTHRSQRHNALNEPRVTGLRPGAMHAMDEADPPGSLWADDKVDIGSASQKRWNANPVAAFQYHGRAESTRVNNKPSNAESASGAPYGGAWRDHHHERHGQVRVHCPSKRVGSPSCQSTRRLVPVPRPGSDDTAFAQGGIGLQQSNGRSPTGRGYSTEAVPDLLACNGSASHIFGLDGSSGIIFLGISRQRGVEQKMTVTPATKQVLAFRSGGVCAFPGCGEPLASDSYDGPRSRVLGEVAHIRGRRSGSERYDPNMTEEERNAVGNLVYLCANHHKLIDADAGNWPAEDLLRIKQEHEAAVRKTRERTFPLVTFSELREAVSWISGQLPAPNPSFDLAPTEEKIKKNGLSDDNRYLIATGLTSRNTVAEFIQKAAQGDPDFPNRLKAGFLEVYYAKVKEGYKNNILFELMCEFSERGLDTHGGRAAGIAVLVYLFETCEVFEK